MSHQQNAADYSDTMQNINKTAKNISKLAQGYKANLSNPSKLRNSITYYRFRPCLYISDFHSADKN
ncbi:hypothetical protein AOQ84DRAFT_278989 [Glonium stellatum]|uniref:Uncharacterized protein n=1 Tax=Glonium stellatum TaxID=574774 RepID=A0A8E2K0C5_9PEZI|nr:hypothetical protein AOQ84DRAFT_278989 [Glonium stellatum]